MAGLSVTLETNNLPRSFLVMTPTAASSYLSTTKPAFAANPRKNSMWQLDSDATSASSGSTTSARESGSLPRRRPPAGGTLDPAVEPPHVTAAVAVVGEDGALAGPDNLGAIFVSHRRTSQVRREWRRNPCIAQRSSASRVRPDP